MSDLAKEEARYKPYTLRRLSDFAPDEKSERPEGLLTAKQLKEDVYENLDMIFNSRSHAGFQDFLGYEDVEDSVLGYGIPDFCGRQSSTASREALRASIFKQLRLFESRLDPASIMIDLLDTKDSSAGNLGFRISGQIRTKEVSGEVVFISRLNLESGNAELRFETA